MTAILIRSAEKNAVATALLFAGRGHRVALLGNQRGSGTYDVDYYGVPRRLEIHQVTSITESGELLAMVFAEGEDLEAGIAEVLDTSTPTILAIVGGGPEGAVRATTAALQHGFDTTALLLVGGFITGGDEKSLQGEKRGVLAGFVGAGTSESITELAVAVLEQVAFTSAASAALSSLNALLHVPPMILNAGGVERAENLEFYTDGFGPAAMAMLEALDSERRALGTAMGHELPGFEELMDRYNASAGMAGETMLKKINSFTPYRGVRLPSGFGHRFLAHELSSSLAPMAELAMLHAVPVPTIRAVVRIGEVLLGRDLSAPARDTAKKFARLFTDPGPDTGCNRSTEIPGKRTS